MSKSSRTMAFLAYLLSFVGALYVLIARQDDRFAVFHARQSLGIVLVAIVTPLLWGIVAWAGAWVPVAGPLIGLMLFALVIAISLMLVVSWLTGMVFALQGRMQPVPLVGSLVVRRPKVVPTGIEDIPPELLEEIAVTPAKN